MTGDPDHDFSAMMIPHHQGAIDMAKAVLLHGKDPVLRRLAQEIIVTQQQEIQVMRLRLVQSQTGATSAPPPNQQQTTAAIPVSNRDRVYTADQTSNTVSVSDPVQMKEVRRVQTANGPGMVLFRPDGRYAFVPSSFTPELDVVDTQTYSVVARVPQFSPFSPNLAVSQDGTEVWFTLKDSGRTQVMSAEPPFRILATLDTGPITNHVTLLDNPNGKFAYVTVGERNEVKVYRRGDKPALVATIPTGDLPHGIWGSGDGRRVYVGLENQDAVLAIDTLANKVLTTISIGQQPQALVYVPKAVPDGDGTANLMPLGEAGKAAHLTLIAPEGSGSQAHATVSVNALGPLDLLQIAVSGLKPAQTYQLWLVTSRTAPFGLKQPLVNVDGELVGINTFILSQGGGNEGLGFAIPSAIVAYAYPQLRKLGHLHRGATGPGVQSITPDLAAGLKLATDAGVIISDVEPESPAETAGLKVGDIITSIDGYPVNGLPALATRLFMRSGGEQIKLGVRRGSSRLVFSVPLVESTNDFDTVAALAQSEKSRVSQLGIIAMDIDPQIAAKLTGLRVAAGVLVVARQVDSTADVSLEAGAIIHTMNGASIRSIEELRSALNHVAANTPVVLQIERSGKLLFVAFKLSGPE